MSDISNVFSSYNNINISNDLNLFNIDKENLHWEEVFKQFNSSIYNIESDFFVIVKMHSLIDNFKNDEVQSYNNVFGLYYVKNVKLSRFKTSNIGKIIVTNFILQYFLKFNNAKLFKNVCFNITLNAYVISNKRFLNTELKCNMNLNNKHEYDITNEYENFIKCYDFDSMVHNKQIMINIGDSINVPTDFYNYNNDDDVYLFDSMVMHKLKYDDINLFKMISFCIVKQDKYTMNNTISNFNILEKMIARHAIPLSDIIYKNFTYFFGHYPKMVKSTLYIPNTTSSIQHYKVYGNGRRVQLMNDFTNCMNILINTVKSFAKYKFVNDDVKSNMTLDALGEFAKNVNSKVFSIDDINHIINSGNIQDSFFNDIINKRKLPIGELDNNILKNIVYSLYEYSSAHSSEYSPFKTVNRHSIIESLEVNVDGENIDCNNTDKLLQEQPKILSVGKILKRASNGINYHDDERKLYLALIDSFPHDSNKLKCLKYSKSKTISEYFYRSFINIFGKYGLKINKNRFVKILAIDDYKQRVLVVKKLYDILHNVRKCQINYKKRSIRKENFIGFLFSVREIINNFSMNYRHQWLIPSDKVIFRDNGVLYNRYLFPAVLEITRFGTYNDVLDIFLKFFPDSINVFKKFRNDTYHDLLYKFDSIKTIRINENELENVNKYLPDDFSDDVLNSLRCCDDTTHLLTTEFGAGAYNMHQINVMGMGAKKKKSLDSYNDEVKKLLIYKYKRMIALINIVYHLWKQLSPKNINANIVDINNIIERLILNRYNETMVENILNIKNIEKVKNYIKELELSESQDVINYIQDSFKRTFSSDELSMWCKVINKNNVANICDKYEKLFTSDIEKSQLLPVYEMDNNRFIAKVCEQSDVYGILGPDQVVCCAGISSGKHYQYQFDKYCRNLIIYDKQINRIVLWALIVESYNTLEQIDENDYKIAYVLDNVEGRFNDNAHRVICEEFFYEFISKYLDVVSSNIMYLGTSYNDIDTKDMLRVPNSLKKKGDKLAYSDCFGHNDIYILMNNTQ